jgi:soluble P-type ATPase
METEPSYEGIQVDIPNRGPLTLKDLILDFTGTLSCDGILMPGVAERLERLGHKLRITVLTADTFGTAAKQLEGLPVRLHRIRTGHEKADFMCGLNLPETAAIGNGCNDVQMVRMAALGIAVIGPEGCAGDLIVAAKVVSRDILEALDTLSKPIRLKATLRG